MEAVFKRLKGIKSVVSGYAGGKEENATYSKISSGETEHAEVVQVTFDPGIISYEDLLYVFWRMHDPTTPDRQGPDVGHQYRSVIFYHDDVQKELAEKTKKEAQKLYDSPIVTEIVPFVGFWEAEDYHKDYYEKNSNARYCRAIIDPKIEKLQKSFGEYLE